MWLNVSACDSYSGRESLGDDQKTLRALLVVRHVFGICVRMKKIGCVLFVRETFREKLIRSGGITWKK